MKMDYSVELNETQFGLVESILEQELIQLGVKSVMLIDMAGNILVSLDDGQTHHDEYSLAALAAGNFGAVSAMAKIIGEQDFALLFHKGENDSIHFSRVTEDLLLIAIFGANVSLGFLRLKVAEAIRRVLDVV